jgi:hypothetical protein
MGSVADLVSGAVSPILVLTALYERYRSKYVILKEIKRKTTPSKSGVCYS